MILKKEIVIRREVNQMDNKLIYRELPSIPVTVEKGASNIIDGRQKLWIRILEYIFTTLGWMYILTYVIFIIYGSLALTFGWYIPDLWIYNRHMLEETSNLIYALLVIILVVILVMTFWRSYNSIRFGKLRRRQMPLNVSDKEISDYFKVSEEQVKKYKKERIVIFDDNVI